MSPIVNALDPTVESGDSRISRILIVGVSGYLGSALAMGLREDYEVFGTYFQHPTRIEGVTSLFMNCLNGGEIFDVLKRFKPSLILFCAGLGSVDACQANKNLADSLNLKAPAMFFKVLPTPVQFVYFSSDQVFNDPIDNPSRAPFKESERPNPVNIFGSFKSQAESMVLSNQRFTHVFRLSEVFGEPLGGDTSISRGWIDNLRSSLEKNKSVVVSSDEVRSYLYVGDFIRAMRLAIKSLTLASQNYNLAGHDSLSQENFARLFCEKFGYDSKLLRPVTRLTDPRTRAPQPENASLSVEKFENAFGFRFQTVGEGLRELRERLRTGFTKSWK